MENDFDDLHLHHDHNTKHLFRNVHHSEKLVNKLNEMRKYYQKMILIVFFILNITLDQ
jgi:hypothetical protein